MQAAEAEPRVLCISNYQVQIGLPGLSLEGRLIQQVVEEWGADLFLISSWALLMVPGPHSEHRGAQPREPGPDSIPSHASYNHPKRQVSSDPFHGGGA